MEDQNKKKKCLNFYELRKTNVERCEDVFHSLEEWELRDWALAMIGEAGEVCNEVKKLKYGDGSNLRLALELADVVIYADLLAARQGIDLGRAVIAKFNAVSRKKKSHIFLRDSKNEQECCRNCESFYSVRDGVCGNLNGPSGDIYELGWCEEYVKNKS